MHGVLNMPHTPVPRAWSPMHGNASQLILTDIFLRSLVLLLHKLMIVLSLWPTLTTLTSDFIFVHLYVSPVKLRMPIKHGLPPTPAVFELGWLYPSQPRPAASPLPVALLPLYQRKHLCIHPNLTVWNCLELYKPPLTNKGLDPLTGTQKPPLVKAPRLILVINAFLPEMRQLTRGEERPPSSTSLRKAFQQKFSFVS